MRALFSKQLDIQTWSLRQSCEVNKKTWESLGQSQGHVRDLLAGVCWTRDGGGGWGRSSPKDENKKYQGKRAVQGERKVNQVKSCSSLIV